MKRYIIDFYDMIDGWIHLGEYSVEHQFDDKSEAIEKCKVMQAELDDENVHASEHYAVIDLEIGREVWCGLKYDERSK